jgi:hypothetical protein
MRRIIVGGILAAALLAGCDTDWMGYYVPVDRYPSHDHELRLYVRTLNQPTDSAFSSFYVMLAEYSYARPARGPAQSGRSVTRGLPKSFPVELSWPDTDWHEYRTTLRHFAGYQSENGGDTQRLAALEPGDDWLTALTFDRAVATPVGDVATTSYLWTRLSPFPDTVRGDRPIEVEITVDAARALTRHPETPTARYRLDTAGVTIRQRPDNPPHPPAGPR